MRRSLLSSATVNLSANALGSLLAALTMLVAVRGLSVAQWGESAALLGIGQFAGGALSFGIPALQVRNLSVLPETEYRRTAFLCVAARWLLGLTLAGVGLALAGWFAGVGAAVILAAGVFVSLGATAPFIARRRYLAAGIVLVAEKGAAIVAVGWLATAQRLDVLALPLVVGVAGLSAGSLAAIWIGFSHGWGQPRALLHGMVTHWHGSLFFGIATVAPAALLLDTWVVSIAASQAEAGAYAVGSRLLAPLSVVATTIAQVLMPTMAARGPGQLHGLRPRSLMLIVVGGIIVSATLMWIGPVAAVQLLGPGYGAAEWPIRFFVLNAAVVLVTRTLVTILQAWHREAIASGLVASQVGFALLGVYVCSGISGAGAAAMAVVLSNLLLAGALGLAVRRTIANAVPSPPRDLHSCREQGAR